MQSQDASEIKGEEASKSFLGLSCLDAVQEPGHVLADVSHGGKALGVPIGVAGRCV